MDGGKTIGFFLGLSQEKSRISCGNAGRLYGRDRRSGRKEKTAEGAGISPRIL